jgi:hypothetical protein
LQSVMDIRCEPLETTNGPTSVLPHIVYSDTCGWFIQLVLIFDGLHHGTKMDRALRVLRPQNSMISFPNKCTVRVSTGNYAVFTTMMVTLQYLTVVLNSCLGVIIRLSDHYQEKL